MQEQADTTDADESPVEEIEPQSDTAVEPAESSSDVTDPDEPETFPRDYVEQLRQENGKYRQRAQKADAYAQRLHTELVRAAGRLADPTDLPFLEEHLDDPDALAVAVDDEHVRREHG